MRRPVSRRRAGVEIEPWGGEGGLNAILGFRPSPRNTYFATAAGATLSIPRIAAWADS
jgi:hypothetical protein